MPAPVGTAVAITWGTGATPASQNVTPPIGCTCLVMTWTYYAASAGAGLSSVTLNSVAPDLTGELAIETPDQPAAGYAVWWNPPTGSAIPLAVAWDASPAEGPTTFVSFFDDVDTASLRDSDFAHVNGTTQQTLTLTTVANDLVLVHDQRYLSIEPGNESGYTSLATMSNNFEFARLRYIIATGTTQTASTQDTNFSSIVAIVLRDASAGGGISLAWIRA